MIGTLARLESSVNIRYSKLVIAAPAVYIHSVPEFVLPNWFMMMVMLE